MAYSGGFGHRFFPMKKKQFISIFFFLVLLNAVMAQKHDNVWVMGEGSVGGFKGNNKISFEDGHFSIDNDVDLKRPLQGYNVSASDSMGNFMFYFNGLTIYDADDQLMENGRDINRSVLEPYYEYLLDEYLCLEAARPAMFIPLPGQINEYLLIHGVSVNFINDYTCEILYSRIAMDRNGGKGAVVEKNRYLVDGYVDALGLTKHANGIDWWLVTSDRLGNTFYVFLISEMGITGPKTISTGPEFSDYILTAEGSSKPIQGMNNHFSPEGDLYIRNKPHVGIYVYSFDRCTGEISYERKIETAHIGTMYRTQFSSNGQYLYAMKYYNAIYQYDMKSSEDNTDWIPVCKNDGFGNIWDFQLAIDGRIYIVPVASTSYSRKFLGYINRPNLPGLTCDVRLHSIELEKCMNASIPHFPNYRLGPLEGVECDELEEVFQPLGDPDFFEYDSTTYQMIGRFKLIHLNNKN